MSEDLSRLEEWAGALVARLQPAERRRLNQQLARDLRRSQQRRIATQRNPDGIPFAPRKQRDIRGKRGHIRRQMFMRLRTAAHLKLDSGPDHIGVAFLGRTARIARVHQRGLRDRPARGAPDVRYPQRQLLGFSPDDIELIQDGLLRHLTGDL